MPWSLVLSSLFNIKLYSNLLWPLIHPQQERWWKGTICSRNSSTVFNICMCVHLVLANWFQLNDSLMVASHKQMQYGVKRSFEWAFYVCQVLKCLHFFHSSNWLSSIHIRKQILQFLLGQKFILITIKLTSHFRCSLSSFPLVSQKLQKTTITYIQIKVSNVYSQRWLEHSRLNVNRSKRWFNFAYRGCISTTAFRFGVLISLYLYIATFLQRWQNMRKILDQMVELTGD